MPKFMVHLKARYLKNVQLNIKRKPEDLAVIARGHIQGKEEGVVGPCSA